MNKFKVLLVYPNLPMVNLLPSNIAILSACLKEAGIDVKLFDTTLYNTAGKSVDEIRVEHLQLRAFNLNNKGVEYKGTDACEDFVQTVDNYKPDIIGVSATDDTYELGIKLVASVKNRNIFTIVGGVYPTFSPEKVINNKNVDAICVGEGEEALVELCRRMIDNESIANIKNIWVKENGRICKNSMRAAIDLDKLPYEDYTLFEEKRLYRPMQGKIYRMIPITIDRGCPYNCSYCAAPSQRLLYKNEELGRYFRIKSTKRVIDELQHNIDKYKADYVYFNSETFFAKKEDSIEEFAREYAKKIGLPFWCQTRIETITENRIKILEDMNCDRISIGLEHGNEEFRKKILKKPFSNKQVINAFNLLERSRIPVTVNNIIGFPDETRDIAFDTILLNRKISADSYTVCIFTPFTGTPLRQYCIDKGYLESDSKSGNVFTGSILVMPDFSQDQIMGLVRTFPLYVKMQESYFDKIKIAEQLNEKGNRMFAELREVYSSKYFFNE